MWKKLEKFCVSCYLRWYKAYVVSGYQDNDSLVILYKILFRLKNLFLIVKYSIVSRWHQG